MQLDESLTRMQWYEQQLAPAASASPAPNTPRDTAGGRERGSPPPHAAAEALPLRPLRVSTGKAGIAAQESDSSGAAAAACSGAAAPLSPSSMPLARAGAQARLSPQRAGSPTRPPTSTPPGPAATRSAEALQPQVASFGLGPVVDGPGTESVDCTNPPAAVLEACNSPLRSEGAVGSGAVASKCETPRSQPLPESREPFADVGNCTPTRLRGEESGARGQQGTASAPGGGPLGPDSARGDASLDAWRQKPGAPGGDLPPRRDAAGTPQRSYGMQAGEGRVTGNASVDMVVGVAVREDDAGAPLWDGARCRGPSAELGLVRRNGDAGRGRYSREESSRSDASGSVGWPVGIRPDESVRSSVGGEGAPGPSGLQRELQNERMRNEALLFTLQQARAGRRGGEGEDGGGGVTARKVKTADAGCQMVFSHVFALDAVIQCNLGREGLAGVQAGVAACTGPSPKPGWDSHPDAQLLQRSSSEGLHAAVADGGDRAGGRAVAGAYSKTLLQCCWDDGYGCLRVGGMSDMCQHMCGCWEELFPSVCLSDGGITCCQREGADVTAAGVRTVVAAPRLVLHAAMSMRSACVQSEMSAF